TFTFDPVYNKQNDRRRIQSHPEHLQDQSSCLRDDVGHRCINRVQNAANWFPTSYRFTGADYFELSRTK
ncbi:Uncharacterized protein FKW44_012810, partial [Caligus rogercresseyi]